jgi:hypothetical protein
MWFLKKENIKADGGLFRREREPADEVSGTRK